ncbi:MAG: (2Fe-2S)-binding protein [Saprospiraceae bacterium]|jgi:isoquinoline 1-oxidoreductase alpha subunit
MIKKFTVRINKKSHTVMVDENMPLLWLLRDILDLKGTKYGCGVGSCGACTVHLNGSAVRSCQLPISVLGRQEITTIEGLAEKGDHPVQKAWLDEDVAQCGYCQPGQIMSAVALLNNTPKPTEEDIDNFMTGNICRCGTYIRIKKAILKAATSN